MVHLIRRTAAALAACAIVISVPSVPRAQSVPAIDKRITYILPQWDGLVGGTPQSVGVELADLRARLGPEGPRVRLGFTTYVNIQMSPVNPADTAAVRAALAPMFAQVDKVIANAVANNMPICLSFLTALRGGVDPLQAAAQTEDRRTMQWHNDGSLAPGWVTFSRYARKHKALEEAFIREVGRGIAARMLQYPDILVAASGDGEVEMSYEYSSQFFPDRLMQGEPSRIADYSPFAVAEFRDWLRGTGLYAAGQPFAGEAYRNSARYAADASLATLNADFQQSFTTWALKYEDWSLADSTSTDPNAIPASTYSSPGWTPAVDNVGGFDPPRVHTRGNAWSDLWDEFRYTMVYRYNLNFAKWMTTSPDAATGATIPVDRWFTDQIPADYLFGFTPQNPDVRLDTSASPYWTADVSPYGSMGITSFNANANGTVFRTLNGVAPLIAQRKVRWGIFEWSPSVPVHPDVNVYRAEMALVEQYRPSLLAPFHWSVADYPIKNTGFETALKELIDRIKVIPLTLSRSTLVAAASSDGTHRTPPQTVRVGGAPGETPPWSVSAVSSILTVTVAPDGRSFTVAPVAQAFAPGVQQGTVVLSSSDPGYSPVTLTVTLNVTAAGATAAPVGSFDTPAADAVVSGEVGVTGWAVDDVGIVGIDIHRSPLAGEPTGANGLVFLGSATLVSGARPDVANAFTDRPLSEQAGWGYMLLTNMLPNQGNGPFTLHAVARDVDGHTTLLGSRQITCQNSSSLLPFGTIDTPGQGETVSGTILNFGWALSPTLIATDGSTIGVYIDGVFVGRPTYNQVRPDIATLFPGYPNTSNGNGAIGFFQIDTTQYANGVHTIAWIVTDSAGRAQGIGSRYFTIANP
jgi:hypothetical protein